ncbi:hypothetical protein ACTD5D_32105 [Nocardia takedensis]|uniref:hypothetical protein n=1 Tax=Nocardia takedensis TaxID=259390 RepID=UPI003F772152
MPLPDLSAHEHEVAAQECDTLAVYLDQLADLATGELAGPLARAHRSTAAVMRARAGRHRDRAGRLETELVNRNAVTLRNDDAICRPDSAFVRLPRG